MSTAQQFVNFDALLFPADGRPPKVVQLMTSPAGFHAGQQLAVAGERLVPRYTWSTSRNILALVLGRARFVFGPHCG